LETDDDGRIIPRAPSRAGAAGACAETLHGCSLCAVAVLQAGSGVARPVDMAQGTAFLSSFALLSPDKRKAQLGMVSICSSQFSSQPAPGCYENCGRVHTAAS